MKDKKSPEDVSTPDLNENLVEGYNVMQEVMHVMTHPQSRRSTRTFAWQFKRLPANRIAETPPTDKIYEHTGYAHLPRHSRRNQ